MAVVRVRQHVNPLGQRYQQAIAPPQWSQVFADPTRPLHLDIGCARGRFLLEMAEQEPAWNFLGLEIREPLVQDANRIAQEQGMTNLHYLFCNVNKSLTPILTSLPPEVVQRVSIQFPDPWFKKRHQKRRVVQPEVVNALAQYLPDGAMVFLQSDVQSVAQEMGDRFHQHSAFHQQGDSWLPENPLAVATERELYTLAKGEPVYRLLYRKQGDRLP